MFYPKIKVTFLLKSKLMHYIVLFSNVYATQKKLLILEVYAMRKYKLFPEI